ncbi:MAG: hypothetical protein QM779_15255 [Propionicimonas sp.]|uniref:hypothetical protein n=1 Tax=Propionicimonas sp. TaxID=1955623 RepID=UPI003D11EDEE
MNPLEALDHNRYLCTGVGLGPIIRMVEASSVSTEADFNEVVNQCYQLWHEQLGADVAFLATAARELCAFTERDRITDFDGLIDPLRNGSFHSGAARAKQIRSVWVDRRKPWSSAASQILQELESALAALAIVSGKVRIDGRLKQAWSDRTVVDPASVFAAVARDMAINLPAHVQSMKISDISRRAKRLGPDDDVHAALEDFAVEELIQRPRRLPVAYYDVLDRLGVLGRREAKGALLLAFGLAQTTRLGPDEFLDRVEQLWTGAK